MHVLVVCVAPDGIDAKTLQSLINGLMLEIYRYSALYGDDHHSIRENIGTRTRTDNNEFHLTASKREFMKPVAHPMPVYSTHEDDPKHA